MGTSIWAVMKLNEIVFVVVDEDNNLLNDYDGLIATKSPAEIIEQWEWLLRHPLKGVKGPRISEIQIVALEGS